MISGSEIAFFSLTHNELQNLKTEDKVSSKRIVYLRTIPRSLLATILISNNFINIGIVVLSDFLILKTFGQATFNGWAHQLLIQFDWLPITQDFLTHAINLTITVMGVTFLLVLFGEVTPKIYARLNNLQLARTMSGPLLVMSRILKPASNTMVRWTNKIEKRVNARSLTASDDHKSEIDQAIDLAVSSDIGSEEEIDILKSIIKFNEVTATQIMRPRVDVIAVSITISYDELLTAIRNSGYSRIPVYDDDFDHVKGILYAKDLIAHLDKAGDFKWQDLIRTDLLYVPETKRINELLKDFQERRMHMAIVVDEFGGSSGIVTLEDVMEEVIGEIKDEFDQEREFDFVKIDKHNFIFEGKTLLNDVCRIVGIDTRTFDAAKGESDTLAGLMLEIVGNIPGKGEEVELGNYTLKAQKVSDRRIEKVKLTIN